MTSFQIAGPSQVITCDGSSEISFAAADCVRALGGRTGAVYLRVHSYYTNATLTGEGMTWVNWGTSPGVTVDIAGGSPGNSVVIEARDTIYIQVSDVGSAPATIYFNASSVDPTATLEVMPVML